MAGPSDYAASGARGLAGRLPECLPRTAHHPIPEGNGRRVAIMYAERRRPASAKRIAADQNGPISRSANLTPMAVAPAGTTNTRNAAKTMRSGLDFTTHHRSCTSTRPASSRRRTYGAAGSDHPIELVDLERGAHSASTP